MANGLGINLPSLQAQNALAAQQRQLETSNARLASGLRINSAKDDAAGLAIATRMTTELRSNTQLQKNITSGLSLVQSADAALGSIQSMLQRLRELAVMAASETLNADNREALHQEFRQLSEEIDHVAAATELFGNRPLYGARLPQPPLGQVQHLIDAVGKQNTPTVHSSGIRPVAYIPAGTLNLSLRMNSYSADDDLQLFTTSGQHLVGSALTGANADQTWQANGVTDIASAASLLLTEDNGFQNAASYDDSALFESATDYFYADDVADYPATHSMTHNGMTITYSGDGERFDSNPNDGHVEANYNEFVHIDNVSEDLLLVAVGRGAFETSASWDSVPTDPVVDQQNQSLEEPLKILVSAPSGGALGYIEISKTPADSRNLGIAGVWLGDAALAASGIANLDAAINRVSSYRASYGALATRFEAAFSASLQTESSLGAARSRVLDADVAVESSSLSRSQVLQQSATSMLAQANLSSNFILQLLK